MEISWIFPAIISMQKTIERIIPHAVENARDNPLWDHIADDLIDAKHKLDAAIKVIEGRRA